jgi:hypothetical protein
VGIDAGSFESRTGQIRKTLALIIKQTTVTRQCIIFLILFPLLTFGQYARRAKVISFYWGPTYRLDNNFYNSFDISIENYFSSCTSASYKGYGVRLDNFNNDNYSLSVRLFKSYMRRPDQLMTPYLGISPVVFTMSEHIGLNIKPELGVRFNSGAFTRRQPISISINISYGYDIPIIEEKQFIPGRHDFIAKLHCPLILMT